MEKHNRGFRKEVFKVWQLDYKGHIIRIVNAVTEEVLSINNEVVDKKVEIVCSNKSTLMLH